MGKDVCILSCSHLSHLKSLYAAEHDIRVLLETHDPAWSRSANTVALIEAAGQPPAGILYDVLHPCRMGESVQQTVATLGRHVELVHLKDGRRPPDRTEEWPLCALGEGNVPFDTVLFGLSTCGYEGWYTFEWEKRWHPELAEPKVALPAGVAFLRALAASVSASSPLLDEPPAWADPDRYVHYLQPGGDAAR